MSDWAMDDDERAIDDSLLVFMERPGFYGSRHVRALHSSGGHRNSEDISAPSRQMIMDQRNFFRIIWRFSHFCSSEASVATESTHEEIYIPGFMGAEGEKDERRRD